MMGYVFMRFGTDFRPENVDRLREKVTECLKRAQIEGSTAFLVVNLMDELICNILEHGAATWVELEVHPLATELRLILRDDGSAFDPGDGILLEKESGPIDPNGRHMGLYMVGNIADSWTYKRTHEGTVNELELIVDLENKLEGAKNAAH